MFLVEHIEFAKNWLVSKDQSFRLLLHVHIGLTIYIIAAQFSRRKFASTTPLWLLLLLEGINEIADMWGRWSFAWSWRWRDTFSDVINTMFWPTILYLIARSRELASKAEE